jgi:hypothetical protein
LVGVGQGGSAPPPTLSHYFLRLPTICWEFTRAISTPRHPVFASDLRVMMAMECPGVSPFFDIPILADCSCSRTLLQSSARASPMRHHDRASLSRIFQSYARIDRQGGQPAADAPRRPDLHRCRATHCLARPNLDAQLPVAWADPSGATHRRSWSIGSQERSRIDCNPDPGLA